MNILAFVTSDPLQQQTSKNPNKKTQRETNNLEINKKNQTLPEWRYHRKSHFLGVKIFDSILNKLIRIQSSISFL
jgi:hypothetical protein